MKAKLITPIERLRGQLKKDGYYFRMYRGEQIVQRCPTKWEDTPARKAAREKFVERYGKGGKVKDAALTHRAEDETNSRHHMPEIKTDAQTTIGMICRGE